jgi:mRNA interferase MazF
MISYSQGDIVTVWFPDSNLLTVKKRPGIVLQKDHLNTNLDQLIIGMVTSNLARKGHASRRAFPAAFIFINCARMIAWKRGRWF